MPPHRRKNSSFEIIRPWQLVWNYFLDQNIPLFPHIDSLPSSYEGDFLVLGPQTIVESEVSSLPLVLDMVQSFWSTIQIELDTEQAVFEWNYLGLSAERKSYTNYLSTLFWQNQNSFEYLADYQELVAEPWRCLNYIANLEDTVEHTLASDNFSPKSIEFVQLISSKLTHSEYNPYIIHSNEGSFQWSISVPSVYTIEGVLLSEDGKLKHRIDIVPLTEIVI